MYVHLGQGYTQVNINASHSAIDAAHLFTITIVVSFLGCDVPGEVRVSAKSERSGKQ